MQKETDVFTAPVKLLHIAPEIGLARIFRNSPNIDYLPVDLNENNPLITETMDIQDIRYPDGYFDAIYCSNVLEHVPDDIKAMNNLSRVLKKGGWAILNSPVRHGVPQTLEDPRYNTPALRAKYYGQADHLRYYGEDYQDRLEAAGFTVKKISYVHDLAQAERERLGLNEPAADDYIFYCVK